LKKGEIKSLSMPFEIIEMALFRIRYSLDRYEGFVFSRSWRQNNKLWIYPMQKE